MNANDPAFPWEQSPGNQNNLGLTKRELFAMANHAAILSAISRFEDQVRTADPHVVAHLATCHADALIGKLGRP